MDKEVEALLSQQFEEWQHHPVTTMMFKAIAKHKESFAVALMSGTNDYNVPDAKFRNLAYGMRSVDAVCELMTKFDKFKQALNK